MSLIDDKVVDGDLLALDAQVSSVRCKPSTEQAIHSANLRYRVLAWLTTAAGLAYLCRNATGVAESAIREELGLTLEQSGWFMGAFFWTYAAFHVPSGWLAERIGTRIALSIFALAWSTAMIGTGLAPVFWLLMFAQLAMGVAQAGLVPATVNSIGHWMPLAQRSAGCGILGAGMQFGAIAASGITGAMLSDFGWRFVFLAFALPGVLWTIGFLARFRDDPAEVLPPGSSELELIRAGRSADDLEIATHAGELRELLAIARNPTMLWLCGQQICRSAGYIFFASWFPTYLQKTRGVTVEESGYLQGVVQVGPLLGCVLGGLLTDWIWRRTGSLRVSRTGVGAVSLGIGSIAMLGAWLVETTDVAMLLLTLGAFCTAFAGPCALAVTIDIGGPRVPQVAGIVNMSGNLAAGACPILVGMLFQLTENWDLILLFYVGVFLLGAICWLFVNPQSSIVLLAEGEPCAT
jgi:ACS family glucarate transporter-like MFS transporter/ACS family D-galactonate transporter-like MFS transporter